MESEIEVTVLMSVYHENRKQLKESIESILNQTYKEYEFLIINDGENKELIELINKYNDKRIIIENNITNIGLEKSLNKGIKMAKGKYILRMDADDIAYKNRIEKQLNFIKKHKEYKVVSSRAELFDENGVYGESKRKGKIEKEDLIKGTPFIHPTMIIDKSVLLEIGGYPEYKRVEDYAMVMNLYAHGYIGYVMQDILLKYRMDKNGYKKKKYRYRIQEARVKLKYFKKMKVKFTSYLFVLKPLIAGIVPKDILMRYHRNKVRRKK